MTDATLVINRQNIADIFSSQAKAIMEKANTLVNKLGSLEITHSYYIYRLSIEGMVEGVKKHLGIDLPGATELPQGDYLAGLIHLADWCGYCASILQK